MSAVTAPILEVGDRLAETWEVRRILDAVSGLEAVLAEGPGRGFAVCYLLSAVATEPLLDGEAATLWGTHRRILHDENFGSVVVDELPPGEMLSERLAAGRPPSVGMFEELQAKVRRYHRMGRAHGQLAPDRIIIGESGIAAAGWSVVTEDFDVLRARDEEAMAAVSALCTGAEGARAVPPDSAADPLRITLGSVLASDHLPTIEGVLFEWESAGRPMDLPEVTRALDAVARLRRRIDDSLLEAKESVERGDPLAAVAACREAIRLGAEEEAEPILRDARREAQRQLGTEARRNWRSYATIAAGGIAALLITAALWSAVRTDPAERRFEQRLNQRIEQRGARQAVYWLLEQEKDAESYPYVAASLAEQLPALAVYERERLIELKRQVVAQGARPREADRLAQQALEELDAVTAKGTSSPGLLAQLKNRLAAVDRAASLYMASGAITADQAQDALDALIAEDPLFRVEGGTP